MNVLLKSKNIPIWSVTLVALGIHGLILAIPIALEEPAQEKPESAPVKMQKLPPSKVSVLPKSKSSPLPSGTIVPPAPITNSSVSTVPQPIVSNPAQQPASQTTPPPQSSTPQPSTPATTPPTTPPTTPATITPDNFQLAGTTACAGIEDCSAFPDQTGRQSLLRLEEYKKLLIPQGYLFNDLELGTDKDLLVSEVTKKGKTTQYLHIVGDGQRTRGRRLSALETDYDKAREKVGL